MLTRRGVRGYSIGWCSGRIDTEYSSGSASGCVKTKIIYRDQNFSSMLNGKSSCYEGIVMKEVLSPHQEDEAEWRVLAPHGLPCM